MADLSNFANSDRDIEQALVALKRGTQLVKYSRKGKPKLRSFRLSSDGTTLIWFSHKKEKSIKLSSVKKIIPGQRTAVFRRYPRPERDYLSFSIIYKDGQRTLDLICKDQAEVEIWFSGLQAVINSLKSKHQRSESSSEGYTFSDEGGDSIRHTTKIFTTNKSFDKSDNEQNQNKMLRGSVDNNRRISASSTPSNTSSGQEDIESLSDVFIWGEVWDEGPPFQKIDVLNPKPLDTDVAMDVNQVSCGFGHVALVTRQGDIYTWGEEYAGRLGRGNELSVSRPKPVEISSCCNMEHVACGEFMTCAINVQGDLFTWGDIVHKAGLLGHGSEAGHTMPKQVSGPLEGLQVLHVSCGSWHTALVTSNQKLFTLGDGAFGVLGHGNRESVTYPKEVEALSGFKTLKAACGVWHTAAIVDMGGQSNGNGVSCKLFTWGDGAKFRLGQGDKEAKLRTHFTMGSNSNGQLGNPQADGEKPCLVQDRLAGELVEEISCGSCHIVALTSRSEVYTWGKGSNGRLGHGDIEDRKTPTLVEALKDRHVKSISCGSNFTACICIHKWVPTNDQSLCAGCRQAFGFTRKRHNCYHCGLVHCHACSSRKALKAQLAPVPSKPHRVCDLCYAKLKSNEGNHVNLGNVNHNFVMTRKYTDQGRSSRLLLKLGGETVIYPEMKARNEGKMDSISIMRASQMLQFPTSFTALMPVVASETVPGNGNSTTSNGGTAPTTPYSRRPSPPPVTAPLFSKSVIDSLKKTNELLNQEVQQLQLQLGELRKKSEIQEELLRRTERKAKKAHSMATKENTKCNATLDLIKSFESQLNDMGHIVPLEVFETLKILKNQVKSIFFPDQADNAKSSTDRPSNGQLELESSGQGNGTRSSIDGNTADAPFVEVEERFAPGVYVICFKYKDGSRVLKTIRFKGSKFSNQEAHEWWRENEVRVYAVYKKLHEPIDMTPPPPPLPPPAPLAEALTAGN
ncbi:hypothetical protein LUZ60_002296 [Juncus effusus]|nr:hypothetical protein LUZ60_002296 [Juncus effusus]